MVQEGVPNSFIQWHRRVGGECAHIALLKSILSYDPHMRIPPLPWDDLSFAAKGEVNCISVRCTNWLI